MPLFPAADADLETVAALVNRAYRGTEGWTHEAAFLAGPRTEAATLLRDLAASPEARVMTLRESPEAQILGVVWLEPATPPTWYLGMLAVRPDLQDRQLGRALLAAAEDSLARRGARRVRMTVLNVRDTLIAWYERRGYVRTGEIQPFPYEDGHFGVPQRDDLGFVVLEKALGEAADGPPAEPT